MKRKQERKSEENKQKDNKQVTTHRAVTRGRLEELTGILTVFCYYMYILLMFTAELVLGF
jgi:hypothetical protein